MLSTLVQEHNARQAQNLSFFKRIKKNDWISIKCYTKFKINFEFDYQNLHEKFL